MGYVSPYDVQDQFVISRCACLKMDRKPETAGCRVKGIKNLGLVHTPGGYSKRFSFYGY